MEFLNNLRSAWHFPTIAAPPFAVEAAFDWREFQVSDFSASRMPMPPPLSHAVASRRAEYLAGRLCARRALELVGNAATAVGYNKDRSPEWPQGTVGSITHTGRIAGAVAARAMDYTALGLDYEWLIESDQAWEIGDTILTAMDSSLARTLPGFTFEQFLTLAFSLKESLYKALYPRTRIVMEFHQVDIIDIDGGRARMRLNRSITTTLPAGMEFDALFSCTDGLVRTLALIRNSDS